MLVPQNNIRMTVYEKVVCLDNFVPVPRDCVHSQELVLGLIGSKAFNLAVVSGLRLFVGG